MRLNVRAGKYRKAIRQDGLFQAGGPVLLVVAILYAIGCAPPSPSSNQVATPVIAPNGGTFADWVKVLLTTTTAGATIYFTTDGSTPTESSFAFPGSIILLDDVTIKARAYKAGMNPSDVASAAFNITQAVTHQYVATYGGTAGSGDDQFDRPQRLEFDADGYLYVIDTGNDRVKKHAGDGSFVWETEPNLLQFPTGLAIGPSGKIYVSDIHTSLYHVQVLDPNGEPIDTIGSAGSLDGQFQAPRDVATDSAGNIYACDTINQRIQKFDPNGAFLDKWGSFGTGDGEFSGPFAIAIDANDVIFVIDQGNSRIQKFDPNGTFLGKWGGPGSGDSQFDLPWDLAIDPAGNVYVADYGNDRIQKFTNGGTYTAQWGSTGTGDGDFDEPTGIAVAPDGTIWVAEQANHRIQKFQPMP